MNKTALILLLAAIAVDGFHTTTPLAFRTHSNTLSLRWAAAEEKTESAYVAPGGNTSEDDDDEEDVPLDKIESLGRGAAKVSN
jgi:hypothetical protein